MMMPKARRSRATLVTRNGRTARPELRDCMGRRLSGRSRMRSSQGITLWGSGRDRPLPLPVALALQGVRHLAGHVFLIVLGEHRISLEHARRVEHALGHDTL